VNEQFLVIIRAKKRDWKCNQKYIEGQENFNENRAALLTAH
jgi:hypothetical protein